MPRTINLCTNNYKIVYPEKGYPYWDGAEPEDAFAKETLLLEKILELEDHAQSLKAALTFGLFSDRDTVEEAYSYALDLLTAPGLERTHAMTALHVLMNTIAKEI